MKYLCASCGATYQDCKCVVYISSAMRRENNGDGRPSLAVHRRRHLSWKAKKAILARFDNKCFYCGADGWTFSPVFDHFIAFNFCRRNDLENYVPSCERCNALKSDLFFKSREEAKAYIVMRLEASPK